MFVIHDAPIELGRPFCAARCRAAVLPSLNLRVQPFYVIFKGSVPHIRRGKPLSGRATQQKKTERTSVALRFSFSWLFYRLSARFSLTLTVFHYIYTIRYLSSCFFTRFVTFSAVSFHSHGMSKNLLPHMYRHECCALRQEAAGCLLLCIWN